MRKFAVPLTILYYLENYRKNPSVASFQLTARDLKFCSSLYLPILCIPEGVQRCFTNFHLEDK